MAEEVELDNLDIVSTGASPMKHRAVGIADADSASLTSPKVMDDEELAQSLDFSMRSAGTSNMNQSQRLGQSQRGGALPPRSTPTAELTGRRSSGLPGRGTTSPGAASSGPGSPIVPERLRRTSFAQDQKPAALDIGEDGSVGTSPTSTGNKMTFPPREMRGSIRSSAAEKGDGPASLASSMKQSPSTHGSILRPSGTIAASRHEGNVDDFHQGSPSKDAAVELENWSDDDEWNTGSLSKTSPAVSGSYHEAAHRVDTVPTMRRGGGKSRVQVVHYGDSPPKEASRRGRTGTGGNYASLSVQDPNIITTPINNARFAAARKFRALPGHVCHAIQGFLPVKSALYMSQVNKHWRQVVFSGPSISPFGFDPSRGRELQQQLQLAQMTEEEIELMRAKKKRAFEKKKQSKKKYRSKLRAREKKIAGKYGDGEDSDDDDDDDDDEDEFLKDDEENMLYFDSGTVALDHFGVPVKDKAFRKEGGVVCLKWMMILIQTICIVLTLISAFSTGASSDVTLAAIAAPCSILGLFWIIQTCLVKSVFHSSRKIWLGHFAATCLFIGFAVLLAYLYVLAFFADPSREIIAEEWCLDTDLAAADPSENGKWVMKVTKPQSWNLITRNNAAANFRNYAVVKVYESFPSGCKVATVGATFDEYVKKSNNHTFSIAKRSLFFAATNTIKALNSYPHQAKMVTVPQQCETLSDAGSCEFIVPPNTLSTGAAAAIIVVIYLIWATLILVPIISIRIVSAKIKKEKKRDQVVVLEAQQREWEKKRHDWIRAHM